MHLVTYHYLHISLSVHIPNTQEPTCTTAFNSTINLYPGFSADLESPYWKDHLYDGYTHVDPLSIPSTTYWRWLSVRYDQIRNTIHFYDLIFFLQVLGSISKGHDAAVAIFLGAMNIIRNNETITGPKLSIEIRTVSRFITTLIGQVCQ